MPLPFIFHTVINGVPTSIQDNFWTIAKVVVAVSTIVLIKLYFRGASDPSSDRPLHGKVIILTGGTSGIGAQVALDLATRGAQLVLLTRQPQSDPFLADYISDLRERSSNNMIYAEQVNLADLHSIRLFATRWIDNAPPRRLDAVVLCAAIMSPNRTYSTDPRRNTTVDGIEATWAINYLANFHLLGILSPALRAQPFDRDVRVVIATCNSYISASPLSVPASTSTKPAPAKKANKEDATEPLDPDLVLAGSRWSAHDAYARSKLALMIFGRAFQRHLDSYKRPDGLPSNTRVVFVDPGLSRTPGTRRWLTQGSFLRLSGYLVAYPLPWLFLKSPSRGAQSLLYAIADPGLARGEGGRMIKECMPVDFSRRDLSDEAVAKHLWEQSDLLVERAEKESAIHRAMKKKDEEDIEARKKQDEQVGEIESLVTAIKKGKKQQTTNNEAKKKPSKK